MTGDAETCQNSPFTQTKSIGNFSQSLNENIFDGERWCRVGSMFESISRKQRAEDRRQKNRELEIKIPESKLKLLLLKSAWGIIGNVCIPDFFFPPVVRHAKFYTQSACR